jgi:hypothetical protein
VRSAADTDTGQLMTLSGVAQEGIYIPAAHASVPAVVLM